MDEIALKEVFEAIRDALKDVKETQKEMQNDISDIKEDVKVHVYRTDLAEQNIELLRKETREGFDKVEKDIEPLQKHVNYVYGAAALIGFILTVVTILNYLKII